MMYELYSVMIALLSLGTAILMGIVIAYILEFIVRLIR